MSFIVMTKYLDGLPCALMAYDIDWVSAMTLTHKPDGTPYDEPMPVCRVHIKSGEMFDVIDDFEEIGRVIESATVQFLESVTVDPTLKAAALDATSQRVDL